jgi:hypothetical protein
MREAGDTVTRRRRSPSKTTKKSGQGKNRKMRDDGEKHNDERAK